MAEIDIQGVNGKVYCDPLDTEVFTQFYPQGGLTPEGLWVPLQANDDGSVVIAPEKVSQTNIFAITSSITPVLVLAEDANRKGFICNNNSSSTCYIAYADTVTNQLYTEILEPGSTFSMDTPIYTGAISAVWDSVNGQLQCTGL